MRPSLIIAIAASMMVGQAFAQNSQSSDSAPPVLLIIPQADDASQSTKQSDTQAQNKESLPTAPRAGASKITENEAKATFESQGFSEITELKKNDDGVWMGKAERDGNMFEIALDFEGNVFFRPAS